MASSPPPLSLWLSTFFFMSLLRVLTTYSERGKEKERERDQKRESGARALSLPPSSAPSKESWRNKTSGGGGDVGCRSEAARGGRRAASPLVLSSPFSPSNRRLRRRRCRLLRIHRSKSHFRSKFVLVERKEWTRSAGLLNIYLQGALQGFRMGELSPIINISWML